MRFAPRVHPVLAEAARLLDDDRQSMASTWRRVGALADDLGMARPGYHSIRQIVGPERRRRAARRAVAREAIGELWAYTGPDVPRLLRAWAEAGSGTTTHRGSAERTALDDEDPRGSTGH